MWFIDLIGGIAELWSSWRFYVCLGISIGAASLLHFTFPDQTWVWFISIPLLICGLSLGLWWQARAGNT